MSNEKAAEDIFQAGGKIEAHHDNYGQCVSCQPSILEGLFDKPQTQSLPDTLDQRGSRYGAYGEMADQAQVLKALFHSTPSWGAMRPPQREALDMIATKLARILCGDPEYRDSWHDIAGYATKAEENCRER